MALNTSKMRSDFIKIAFYFKKLQKNCPAAWGFALRLSKPLVAWGSAPRSLSVIRLSYNSLLNISPKLDNCTFQLLVYSTSTFSKILVNCLQQATALDLLFYDNFAPQKFPLLKLSDDVIVCDLWFGSPNQKSWLRLWLQWLPTTGYSHIWRYRPILC